MKPRVYYIAVAALILAVWGATFSGRHVDVSTEKLASGAPSSSRKVTQNSPRKPKKMFHFNHEPTNSDERAIWDWWTHMHDVDPKFEWKTPLDFYGVVVDQHQQPVPNAKAILGWNDTEGSHERRLETRTNGAFELKNVRGKRLSVHVEKVGYVSTSAESNKSFEYSAFFEPNFYVPEEDKPIHFHLWKLENAEPLLYWRQTKTVNVNDETIWFDISRGTFGKTGDVAFSTRRGQTRAPREFDWSVRIEAAAGAGIAVTNDDLMFEAPETGYEAVWGDKTDPREPSYSVAKKIKFYLKSPEGKYAAIHAEIAHMNRPEAEIKLSAYVNPTGSRNLQYDPLRRINPQ
jgi:hypothetical protein